MKSDASSLSGHAQAAIRERAVKMVLDGHTHESVARASQIIVRTVVKLVTRHRIGGFEGLGELRRGRRPGERMALSETQQAEIVASMKAKNPDQLELGEDVLWSAAAVRALSGRRFGIALPRRTVGVYLLRWG